MHYIAYTVLFITGVSTTQQGRSEHSQTGLKEHPEKIELLGAKSIKKTKSRMETAEFGDNEHVLMDEHIEKRAGIRKQRRSSSSADLFSFFRSSFQQTALQFIQDNPILLDYFPAAIRKTIEASVNVESEFNAPTLAEKLRETYNDWTTYLPDLSSTSHAETQEDSKHIDRPNRVHSASLSSALCAKEKLTPILFVPGLLGSALEERRSNATGLPTECKISSLPGEWNRSWVSVASFLGYRCWREVLKLSLDADVNRSSHVEEKKRCNEWKAGSLASVLQSFVYGLIDLFAPKSGTVEKDCPMNETSSETLDMDRQQTTNTQAGFSQRLMKAKFPEGIEVRPVTDGIEATRCLDSSNRWTCHTTSYFKDLLDYMTKRIVPGHSGKAGFTVKPGEAQPRCPQYVLRRNIEVIPFDFRLGGYELYHAMDSPSARKSGDFGGFFDKLKRKIEDLYRLNGNERVAVVTHSLGGPLTVAFLNTYVDEKWKAKFVKKVITTAAPFGGAVKAVQAALLGETESFLVPAWSTQSMLSSWPGIYMVFPNTPRNDNDEEESPHLVEVDETYVDERPSPSLLSGWFTGLSTYFSTPSSTESNEHKASRSLKYAAQGLPEVLRAHPHVPNVYATYLERLRPLFDAFRVPPKGVDIDCIYSTGIKTTKKLIYRTFHEKDVFAPRIETDEEGDGTVRTESLGLCRTWNTDANIDVNIGDDYVDIFGKLPKIPVRKDRASIRRTIKLEGINHVDIISNTPEVWDFILQSVNAE